MSIILSDIDKRILKALQKDGTASSHDLAQQLGMSQSTLWRRVNELEKLGVIRARVAILDPEIVGLPVCVLVNINMKSHEKQARQKFESFVQTAPEIMECYSVTGHHDYQLLVRTASVSKFEEFLMGRILAHDSVSSASSQIALAQQKYTTALPL